LNGGSTQVLIKYVVNAIKKSPPLPISVLFAAPTSLSWPTSNPHESLVMKSPSLEGITLRLFHFGF
jgi:hypothetical protein